MRKTLSGRRQLVAASMLAPTTAFAHDLSVRYGAYLGAAVHPLTELDHLLALLAVGLLAGQQGSPATWRALAALIIGLLFGVALATVPSLVPIEPSLLTVFNLASFFVLGALVAAALRLPSWLVVALAAIVGASHGLENGLDLGDALSVFSGLGVITAGLIAATPVAALAASTRRGWQRVAVRVAGSWIAAIGLIVLGLRFRS
jgi:urease accessory protein